MRQADAEDPSNVYTYFAQMLQLLFFSYTFEISMRKCIQMSTTMPMVGQGTQEMEHEILNSVWKFFHLGIQIQQPR